MGLMCMAGWIQFMWSSCISDLLLNSPTYFAIFWYSWYVRKLQYNDIKANEMNDVKNKSAKSLTKTKETHYEANVY